MMPWRGPTNSCSHNSPWEWNIPDLLELVLPPIDIPHLPLTQLQSFLRLVQRDCIDPEELNHLPLPLEAAFRRDVNATGAAEVLVNVVSRVDAVVVAFRKRRWRDQVEVMAGKTNACESLLEMDMDISATTP